MSQIVVQHLSHSFAVRGSSLSVLDDLSFEVSPGEVVTILGPSGCGKSTLLRCLSDLLCPTSGSVRIGGRPPAALREEKQIGFGFQDPSLMAWRTVEENIALPAQIGRANGVASTIQARVNELLEMIKMKQFRQAFPSQLSGGMKHRTALARALQGAFTGRASRWLRPSHAKAANGAP